MRLWAAVLTNFPETTTGDNEGVIQGNEGAFTGNTIAKSGVVRAPDKLCPVTVNDGGPRLHEWVFNAIQECRGLIEVGDCSSFQFETLARKVRVDKLLNLTIGGVGSVDGGEICEDAGGRLVCRFVDEGLLVRVEYGDVDGLKELWWIEFRLDSHATSWRSKRYSPVRRRRSRWGTMAGSVEGVLGKVRWPTLGHWGMRRP